MVKWRNKGVFRRSDVIFDRQKWEMGRPTPFLTVKNDAGDASRGF
jgi:hypothetical protein